MELLVFAIILTVTGAQESQVNGPQNTLSVVGSNVTLKCSYSSSRCNGTEWLKHGVSPVTVFKNRGIVSAYRDRYSVDNSSGCDLVIKNVQFTDAGRFICRVFSSSKALEKTAYLIIMKTQPNCLINASLGDTVERDGVLLTCEVTYNGTNNASMVWKGVADAPAAVDNGKTIRRSHLVAASVPKVPAFTCNTSFIFGTEVNGVSIGGLATNMPVTTCETPDIEVKYSVRDVKLSPSLSNYPTRSSITCSAKGHPSPTFKWQILENDVTWMDISNTNSSEFIISDASSKWYRCVAMNVVRGKRYNETSLEFRVGNTGSASIGAGIGVGILLLLIIVLVVCFCVRSCPGYRCCHAEKKSNDNGAQHVDHEMRSLSSQQPSAMNSSIPVTKTPLVREQESAYASLGEDRNANEYASLELRPKPKNKAGEKESAYASLGEDRDPNDYASLEQKPKLKKNLMVGGQESSYASLGADRDANEYTSLEQ